MIFTWSLKKSELSWRSFEEVLKWSRKIVKKSAKIIEFESKQICNVVVARTNGIQLLCCR